MIRVGLATVSLGLLAVAVYATRVPSGHAVKHKAEEAAESRRGAEPAPSERFDALKARIEELEDQLVEKEGLVKTLSAAATLALSAGERSPGAQAAEAELVSELHGRIANAGLSRIDGSVEAQLESFVESAEGRDLEASLSCGGSLCEISLAPGDDPAELRTALSHLADRGSKELPSRVVLEQGDRRVSVFLATDPESLRSELAKEEPSAGEPRVVTVSGPDDLRGPELAAAGPTE